MGGFDSLEGSSFKKPPVALPEISGVDVPEEGDVRTEVAGQVALDLVLDAFPGSQVVEP